MADLKTLLARLAEESVTGQVCESCGCDMAAPVEAEPVIALSDILKLAGLASDMTQQMPAAEPVADPVHPDGTCTCPHCGSVHKPADMMAAEMEEAAKPDFLDLDKDGNKKEPMVDAAKDAEEEVKEGSAFMQAYRALSQGK